MPRPRRQVAILAEGVSHTRNVSITSGPHSPADRAVSGRVWGAGEPSAPVGIAAHADPDAGDAAHGGPGERVVGAARYVRALFYDVKAS